MESTSNATSKMTGRPSLKLRAASGLRPPLPDENNTLPRWVPEPHRPLSVSQKSNDGSGSVDWVEGKLTLENHSTRFASSVASLDLLIFPGGLR